MLARFTGCHGSIVTTLAGSADAGVVEPGIEPTIDGMAFFTKIAGTRMRLIFPWGARIIVARFTGMRCAFENAVKVARLTRHFAVSANQCKAGLDMIKAAEILR